MADFACSPVGATCGRPSDVTSPRRIVSDITTGDRRSPLHLIKLSFLIVLASCTTDTPNDHPVFLHLANAGTEPLQCRLMFGHWVDRDLGRLAPGESIDIAMTQQGADGALFILRDDGARRMMIETINCGREHNWMETFGQVDLAPARSARPARINAGCAAPKGSGRVVCPQVALEP